MNQTKLLALFVVSCFFLFVPVAEAVSDQACVKWYRWGGCNQGDGFIGGGPDYEIRLCVKGVCITQKYDGWSNSDCDADCESDHKGWLPQTNCQDVGRAETGVSVCIGAWDSDGGDSDDAVGEKNWNELPDGTNYVCDTNDPTDSTCYTNIGPSSCSICGWTDCEGSETMSARYRSWYRDRGTDAPSSWSTYPSSCTTDNTPTFSWTGSPDRSGIAQYHIVIDQDSPPTSPYVQESYQTGSSYTASALSDGLYYAHVRQKDGCDHWSGWNSGSQFRVDTGYPSASININSGDANTTTRWVSLSLSASDGGSGVSEVRYSNDGTSWTSWQSFASSKDWQLSSGEGTKTVYYEVRDGCGLVTQDTDTINFYTTPTKFTMEFNGCEGRAIEDGGWSTYSTTTSDDFDDTGKNEDGYRVGNWLGDSSGIYSAIRSDEDLWDCSGYPPSGAWASHAQENGETSKGYSGVYRTFDWDDYVAVKSEIDFIESQLIWDYWVHSYSTNINDEDFDNDQNYLFLYAYMKDVDSGTYYRIDGDELGSGDELPTETHCPTFGFGSQANWIKRWDGSSYGSGGGPNEGNPDYSRNGVVSSAEGSKTLAWLFDTKAQTSHQFEVNFRLCVDLAGAFNDIEIYEFLIDDVRIESILASQLSDDTPETWRIVSGDEEDYFYHSGNSSYWSVIAAKPPSGANFDLTAYSDSTYSSAIASSTRGAELVDFVMMKAQSGTIYPRVYQTSGSGDYQVEAEYEAPLHHLSWGSYSMGSGELIDLINQHMMAGENYTCNLDITSGNMDAEFYLFGSTGGSGGYLVMADTAGVGGDESFSYTPTSDGWYALLIVNKNGGSSDYQVRCRGTNPSYNSFNIAGCAYTLGTTCYVSPDSILYLEINHSDGGCTPYRQYLAFTDQSCTPNYCGCSWGAYCASGNEIKSQVDVDTNSMNDNMWNDNYLDIQSTECVDADGSCTDDDVVIRWRVDVGSSEKTYDIYTYLYDEDLHGIGYTDVGWDLVIDSSVPIAGVPEEAPSPFSPNDPNDEAKDLSTIRAEFSDSRSGKGNWKIDIKDSSDVWQRGHFGTGDVRAVWDGKAETSNLIDGFEDGTADALSGSWSSSGCSYSSTAVTALTDGTTVHRGTYMAKLNGSVSATGNQYCYAVIWNGTPISISSGDNLSYWLYVPRVSYETCFGVDILLSDNTWIRDANLPEENGLNYHPASSKGYGWSYRTVDLSSKAGLSIWKVAIAFDNCDTNMPSGYFEGYFDDIRIINGYSFVSDGDYRIYLDASDRVGNRLSIQPQYSNEFADSESLEMGHQIVTENQTCGWTGYNDVNNESKLTLSNYQSGVYYVCGDVAGTGGTDSAGTVYIKKGAGTYVSIGSWSSSDLEMVHDYSVKGRELGTGGHGVDVAMAYVGSSATNANCDIYPEWQWQEYCFNVTSQITGADDYWVKWDHTSGARALQIDKTWIELRTEGHQVTQSNDGVRRIIAERDAFKNTDKPDLDIAVVFSGENEIWWIENKDNASSWSFWEVYDWTETGEWWIVTADMDEDGDLDIITCDQNADNLEIYWNDGTPKQTEYWSYKVVLGNIDCRSVFPADVDRDYNPDLVAPAIDGDWDDNMVYCEAPDNPTGAWSCYCASHACGNDANMCEAYGVWPAYIDSDTKIDVAATNDYDVAEWCGYNDRIQWIQQPADPTTTWNWNEIYNTGGSPYEFIVTADMDENGCLDILATDTEDDDVYLFTSGATCGSGWTRYYLANKDSSVPDPLGIRVADIDLDGYLDVVVAAGTALGNDGSDRIVWYKNDGTGLSYTKYVLRDTTSGWGFWAIDVADLDRDGDIDVIFGPTDTVGRLGWCRNPEIGPGSVTSAWNCYEIGSRAGGQGHVWAADIDEDTSDFALSVGYTFSFDPSLKSQVSNIKLITDAYSSESISIYAWDWVDSTWDDVGADVASSETLQTITICSGDCGRYIEDGTGNIKIKYEDDDDYDESQEKLYIDYQYLNITYGAAMSEVTVDTTAPELSADEHEDPTSDSTPTLTGSASEERTYLDEGWYTNETKSATQTNIFFGANDGTFGKFDDCYDSPSVTTSVTYSGEVMKVLDVDGRQIHAGNDNENSNTCISYPWQDVEFAVEDYPIFKFAGRFPEGTTTCLFFYMADTQAATPTWYVVGCTPDGDQGTYTSAPNKLTLIDDDKWHVYEYDLRQIGKAYMDTFEFWDNSGAGSHYYYFDNFIFQSDPWDNIDSTDGAWDEQSESISYTTPTLPDGENTLCLRTRDKAGNIGYVVENAEDGDTIGWDVYDDTPSGATITNVYDATKGSRVIKLEGPGGIENGYRRRNEDLSEWGWTKSKLIQWSMNFSEDYRIFIQTYVKNATVSDYWLFLWYNASDTSGLVYSNPGRYCHHGLGSDTKNGNWYTIIRDLEEDLRDCQPDKELVRIRAIWIRGNGSVDDIMLLSGDCDELTIDTSPPTTTIDSPAASSCQASDFTVAITDSDASPSSGWKGKVDFNDYTISSYGGQDDNSTQWEILDGGKTLHLWGSNWKKIEGPFTIDSDTILKIRFKSTQQGEINGIILDDDNTYPSNGWDGGYLWQFYGTQTFGNQTYNDYSGSDWKTYRIKPSFFGVTGTFQYIVFVNDDDANYASDVYYQLELIGIPARKACSYQVRAYNSSSDTWEVTQDWANRDCPGGDVTLTVGSSGLCKYEGSDACEILVRAEDNAGNIFSTSRKFGADWNIPSTSDDAPSAWQSANVTVTLSPSDSGCGVSNTYYCIDSDLPDCSPTTSGTTVNINCSTQCSSTIRYYSVDQVGNSESTKTSAEIRIDRLKPNATITSPSDGDWVKGTISIKANASDEALKDFKICVDPGHGGSASGATGWDGITLEKDLNLDIALMLRDILEDLGATVIMTRESDVDVSTCSPCTRCQICNDNDTDIFVSIHHNAFDGTVWGTETWYYTGSAKGSSLASKVQDELVSHLGRKDRGTKTSNTLCVLSGTSMPAIIAEIVFMDNESDFNFINQTQNKQEAAKAIAHGILSYFNRTAEDNGGIQWVRMKVDAGAWQYDNSSPHEWSLDTNSISDGAHTIYIEADDSLNNVGTDSIQINVDNTKPVMGQIYMKDEVERNTTQNITVTITDISLLAVASSKVNISIEDYGGGQNQTMSCTNIGGNDYNCSFEYIPTKTNKTVNFTIYARDSVSKTNQTTSSYMVYILRSINLSSGWNLVSLPVDEWETITTEELAQDLGMASMEVIVGQNRTTKKYDINYVVPWTIDDDEPILPGYGYWIGTNAAAGLHWRKGGNYTSITNQLKAGWNIIGSLREMTDEELCADVNQSQENNTLEISKWDTSSDDYISHACGDPSDFAIVPGEGYWVRVKNDVSWSQTGDW